MQPARNLQVVNIRQSLVTFILQSSFFAACCALALCMAAERMMLLEWQPVFTPLHLLIAGATLVEYNLHALFNSSWLQLSKRLKFSVLFFGFLGTLACGISVFYLPFRVLAFSALLGIFSTGYSLPIIPFTGGKRLKDFGLAKILILTWVWVLVTTALPMIYWEYPLKAPMTAELILRFLLIFPLCIAFDIRDINPDKEHAILTLPNAIGLRDSYQFIAFLLIAFSAGGAIRALAQPATHAWWIFPLTGFLAWRAIQKTIGGKHGYYYLLLVDGMMLFYGALSLIF